jgi:spore maturation protein CgeB
MKPHWRGVVDYADLPAVYRSVPIVLDDTAGPTKGHGFLNSRVFDALAGGALVLTDNRVGSQEVFDGLLPVYDDAASLRSLIDRYLGDETARRRLVDGLRSVVLERHTFAHRAEQLLRVAAQTVEAPRVAVKIGAPDWDVAHRWGDLHYARSLIRSLAPWGVRGEIHVRDEWDKPERQTADIVVHLRGLTDYRPKPGAVNVLWVISHPDDVTLEEARRFDLVCVASPVLADTLAAGGVVALVVPQATDATTFGRGTPDDDLFTEVLFVGNTRNQRRASVEWALEAGLPLTVYGQGWDGRIPSEHIGGGYFPNERLPDLYASAEVVLNDHWTDMRESGIVSNRIFDVLAAGGVVVSDPVSGLEEMFDGAVPTYRDAGELGEVVRDLLGDPDRRTELARRGKAAVLGAHTFDHRVRQIVDALRPLLDGRPLDCDGGVLRLPEVQPPVE